MNNAYSSLAQAEAAFDNLLNECRSTCLWFWKPSGKPLSIADRLEALHQIEQNGSLEQFAKARELRQWL